VSGAGASVLSQRLRASVNPAGGLRYHLRALRYRTRLWRGFTEPLAGWLERWPIATSALLLVGPSAGWCLPPAWLARFATIDLVEPDPLARLLFTWRFAALRSRLRWHDGDWLVSGAEGFATARLDALAEAFPGRAVVFCNLLGQLGGLDPAAAAAPGYSAWKAHLARALAGRSWATFHDRLSGPLAPCLPGGSADAPASLTDEEVAARLYRAAAVPAVELLSHDTADLWPDRPRVFFAWEITPGWHHLIEGVRSD
jgi:hypothetical protein